jgi:hypothetical protein
MMRSKSATYIFSFLHVHHHSKSLFHALPHAHVHTLIQIRVNFVRYMILSNGYRSHTCHDVVSSSTFPGVGPNTVRKESNALSLPLQLATNLAASTRGRLVQCSYELVVVLCSSKCCVGDVRCSVPVTIYAHQPAAMVWFDAPPPGWSPQVFPVQQINLPPMPSASMPPAYDVVGVPPGPMQSPGGGYQQHGDSIPPQFGGYPPQQGGGGYPSAPPQPSAPNYEEEKQLLLG